MLFDWPSPVSLLLIFEDRIRSNFQDPASKVFKIVDDSSHEILGFCSLTLFSGEENQIPSQAPDASASLPETSSTINVDFTGTLYKDFAKLGDITKGKRHYSM